MRACVFAELDGDEELAHDDLNTVTLHTEAWLEKVNVLGVRGTLCF